MWLSPWLLARVIQGSLKKERTREEIAASLLCSVASENIVRIFCVVFMMVQLEFLWGASVNHYGNLGKILQPLDRFPWSVGCGTDRCTHIPAPPPRHPCVSSWFSFLQVFSLGIDKGSRQENGSSDFFDVDETS